MTATRKPATRTARLRRWFASDAGQKFTHAGPAMMVFGVAAYQSYWHTVDVATMAHQTWVTAHIMPLSVDGLVMVAARYVTHAKTVLGRTLAVVGFVLGIAATVGANIAAARPDAFDRVVSVWPAVALVATALILHFGDRKPARKPAARRATVTKATPTTKLHSVG